MACHFCSDISTCEPYGLKHINTKLDDHPLTAVECLINSQCPQQYLKATSFIRELRNRDVVLTSVTQFHLALTLSFMSLYDLCNQFRCLTTDTR
jgi:hypothetical protein